MAKSTKKRVRIAGWWRRAAAIAALLLLVGFLAKLVGGDQSIDDFRNEMTARVLNKKISLEYPTQDVAEARRWLVSHQAPVYKECPQKIIDKKGMGCATIKWRNHTVSLICFERSTGKVVHLFIVDREAFGDIADGLLDAKQLDGLATAGWCRGKCVCLLVGSEADIEVVDLIANL